MVGAVRAVDARGAAKLRHCDDDRVAPAGAEALLELLEGAVETGEPVGELPLRRTLVLVRVPALEGERGAGGGLTHAGGLIHAAAPLLHLVGHAVAHRHFFGVEADAQRLSGPIAMSSSSRSCND